MRSSTRLDSTAAAAQSAFKSALILYYLGITTFLLYFINVPARSHAALVVTLQDSLQPALGRLTADVDLCTRRVKRCTQCIEFLALVASFARCLFRLQSATVVEGALICNHNVGILDFAE